MAAHNRSTPLDAMTPQEFADGSFRGVMMAIYYTFNLGDEPNVPYTFDRKTRKAVDEHVRGLYALFHGGKLTPKQGALAEDDGDFQRFMAKAVLSANGGRHG